MKYIKKTYEAGITVEVWKTYRREGRRAGRIGKRGETPEAMARYNAKLSLRELTRTINANFGPGDLHVTLTYGKGERPATPEDFRRDRETFLAALRRLYKREGIPLKYVIVYGYGEKGAPHFHLVVSGIDQRKIELIWKHGYISATNLRKNKEYSVLAAYMFNQSRIDPATGQEMTGRRWSGSRNLVRPQPQVEEVSAKRWREPPQSIKGYIIDPDSIDAGTSPVSGMPYLFYRLLKLPPNPHAMTPDGRLLRDDDAEKWLRQQNAAEVRRKFHSQKRRC